MGDTHVANFKFSEIKKKFLYRLGINRIPRQGYN